MQSTVECICIASVSIVTPRDQKTAKQLGCMDFTRITPGNAIIHAFFCVRFFRVTDFLDPIIEGLNSLRSASLQHYVQRPARIQAAIEPFVLTSAGFMLFLHKIGSFFLFFFRSLPGLKNRIRIKPLGPLSYK